MLFDASELHIYALTFFRSERGRFGVLCTGYVAVLSLAVIVGLLYLSIAEIVSAFEIPA